MLPVRTYNENRTKSRSACRATNGRGFADMNVRADDLQLLASRTIHSTSRETPRSGTECQTYQSRAIFARKASIFAVLVVKQCVFGFTFLARHCVAGQRTLHRANIGISAAAKQLLGRVHMQVGDLMSLAVRRAANGRGFAYKMKMLASQNRLISPNIILVKMR
jgi:hypothetical protein